MFGVLSAALSKTWFKSALLSKCGLTFEADRSASADAGFVSHDDCPN
jgi:hypothetical protein